MMSSTDCLTGTMYVPLIVPILLIVPVFASRLVSKYGPATIRFIATLKPAGTTLLQTTLVLSCVTGLTHLATAVLDVHSNTAGSPILLSGVYLYSAVGMLTATAAAIYIIEAAAADKLPRTVAEVLGLRPLSFAFLRSMGPVTKLATDPAATPHEQTVPGEAATDSTASEGDATDGTDIDTTGDTTLVADTAEQGDFHELTKSDFEGWGPKPR
ncbi:hypothetical protein B0A55_09507 [Friedmanniomyces simplex]|uniref:Uncharacterized protein n=1 Tax=Friedmanniomyces simplex TaxID=329884 RepID=A0A4V5NFZ4_9PEZI|nr:hypothetical protein B0A55_09507 [Friedmanniomyces simplex]